jgi:hypothetical protein
VPHVLDMFQTAGYHSAHARHTAPSSRHCRRDRRLSVVSTRCQDRKRVHHADDMMARITAERLVQHVTASGFVLMKGPPRAAPTTGAMPPGQGPRRRRLKENPTAEAAGELRSRGAGSRGGRHRAATTNLAEPPLSLCETVHTARPNEKQAHQDELMRLPIDDDCPWREPQPADYRKRCVDGCQL